MSALEKFLEDHGDDMLSNRDGRIVVETYYSKKFTALGGNLNRMISFFEDYGDMFSASKNYIAAINKEAGHV